MDSNGRFIIAYRSTNNPVTTSSQPTAKHGRFNHASITRKGDLFTLYLNGEVVTSFTETGLTLGEGEKIKLGKSYFYDPPYRARERFFKGYEIHIVYCLYLIISFFDIIFNSLFFTLEVLGLYYYYYCY